MAITKKELAEKIRESIKRNQQDLALYEENKQMQSIRVGDASFDSPQSAGAAIFAMSAKYKDEVGWKNIGSYKGFDISTMFEDSYYKLRLKNPMQSSGYIIKRGADPEQIIPNIDVLFDSFGKHLEKLEDSITNLEESMEKLKKELETPFAYAEELAEKEARLSTLDDELLNEQTQADQEAEKAEESDGRKDIKSAADEDDEYWEI